MTPKQLDAAKKIAAAQNHFWATAKAGDEPDALARHWRPVPEAHTLTGRCRWSVDDQGHAVIIISRKSGDVITASVFCGDSLPIIEKIDIPNVEWRHLEALQQALSLLCPTFNVRVLGEMIGVYEPTFDQTSIDESDKVPDFSFLENQKFEDSPYVKWLKAQPDSPKDFDFLGEL